MATELIGGAILGTVFGEAADITKEFVKSAREFKPLLVEFKATLDSIEPFIVEITRPGSEQILSQELARQLLDILNEIKPVVVKCTDNNFSIQKKARYARKLHNLEKKLRGFFELNVVAKLLVDTKGILEKLDEMMKLLSNPKPLSPPELSDHEIGGLEKPKEDLEKTTLASNLQPILHEIEDNLTSLEPFFAEITRQDSDQNVLSQELVKQLLDILNQIKPVVREKANYAENLQDSDTKLRQFFQLNVQAKLLVDNKAMLKKFKESERRFDEVMELFLSTMGRGTEALHRPKLPDHKIVGLEKPIEDLKKMVLFDEYDSCGPVVITDLPGSGKTTLATMLCYDTEINEKFGNNIFFVTVSSKPDLESLKKLANKIKEIRNPDILLVLDDVWPNGENIIKDFVFEKPVTRYWSHLDLHFQLLTEAEFTNYKS